jgi:protein-S-isoprenylcysteine O-methyltransferase Ste14
MISESQSRSTILFVAGGIVLVAGCAIAAIGLVIQSRNAERYLDQQYVRRKRGEELPPTDPPGMVRVLEYLGGAVAFVGIVILVAAWTLTPGQT